MPSTLGLLFLGGSLASGYQTLTGHISASRQLGHASDPLPQGSHGEKPWPLFPAGKVPGKQTKQIPPEAYYRADPFNPIGIMCTPYGRAAGNYYYTISEPALVPYLVNKSDPIRKRAAVIIAPGGGNDHLAFDVTGIDMAKWLNSIGISAFVLKYRVPTSSWQEGSLIPLMDGQRALSMVKAHAAGLDFDKVGLMGASAGGELATRLATAEARSYGSIDAVDAESFHPDFMMLLYPHIVPEVQKNARLVPATFITMSVGDPCIEVGSVVSFFEEMKRQQVPSSELHIYPDDRHGYGTCNMYPTWQSHQACQWTKEAERFLGKQRVSKGSNGSIGMIPANFTAMQTKTWCPPAGGRCWKKSECVGHCTADCWVNCP